jgi:hypothetical protein
MLMPAAAAAAPLHGLPHTPVALLGLDVGSLVGDIIRKLVDLVVPDFASHWAIALVSWLVEVPNVTDAHAYPHLNAYRNGLAGVGFGLISVSITVAGLQATWGAPILASAAKRAVVAAGMLVLYPKLLGVGILGINVLTGSLVTSHVVTEGVDKMLGSALVLAVITSGVSLGLAVGAATICMYFIAGLMVIKIGLTSVEALLMLVGALVWGLYPMPGTAWLARAWTAAAVSVAMIPIAWALVFATGALLTSDSLVWATGAHGGLPTDLQQIVKPFTAVACLWVAYKAPSFLLAATRFAGINPAALGPSGGRSSSGSTGRSPLAGAVQTNRDRFLGIGNRAAGRLGPIAANARNRAGALRTSAATSVKKAASPAMAAASVAAGSPLSGRGQVFDDSLKTARRAGVAVKGVAVAPIKANKGWRNLAAEGASQRRAKEFANAPGQSTAASSTAPNANGAGPQRRPDTPAPTPAAITPVTSAAAPVAAPASGPATSSSATPSPSGPSANGTRRDPAAGPVSPVSTSRQGAPSPHRKPTGPASSHTTISTAAPSPALARGAQTAAPVAKPAAPAPKPPAAPTSKPAAPTSKPAAPTSKPAGPATGPSTPNPTAAPSPKDTTKHPPPPPGPRSAPRRPLNEARPQRSVSAPDIKPASPPTRRPS